MIMWLCLWILSIFVWGIMYIQDCFEEVISGYRDSYGDCSGKAWALFLMVVFGGWIFWPYMIFLLAKYIYLKTNLKK